MENNINCNVCNCIHHTENDCCSAKNVSVRNHDACSTKETCCDTFVKKN